ncbi:MAG TPA: YihY/virulence factor BrkB family protein [Actinomycetota bacterium]|nr:YihY/virulence factor BrkB family protein [Actinomycetota bacterium]
MGTLAQPDAPRPAAERVLDTAGRGLAKVWPAAGRGLTRLAPTVGELLIKASRDELGTKAAALTFTAFIALFPALLLATSIAGFWLESHGEESIQRIIRSIPGLEELVQRSAQTIVDGRYAAGVIGAVGLLWVASALSNRARIALAQIFGQRESAVRGRLWAVVATVAVGVTVLIGLGLAGLVTGSLGRTAGSTAGGVLGEAVTLLVLTGAFLLIYLLLLPHAVPARQLLPAAVLCAVGWAILQGVGSWFVARAIARWSALYGTIASVFGVLLFLRIMAWVFLAGAELSSIRRRQAG